MITARVLSLMNGRYKVLIDIKRMSISTQGRMRNVKISILTVPHIETLIIIGRKADL